MNITELVPGLFQCRDTCHVYVVRPGGPGGDAIAIDFGAGDVLDHLDEMQVGRITDVLMTHHHRDQGQGLARAEEAGIRIWVPPVEQDLFRDVESFWAARRVRNDYEMLTDRSALLRSVRIAGTVPEYRSRTFGPIEVRTVPTPGHTPGSVSYLFELAGERLCCTGDLLYDAGRVWSLAATQWTYVGNAGAHATWLSALVLRDERPTVLLPSHGHVMEDAPDALTALADAMGEYADARRASGSADLAQRLAHPFRELSPHLLMNTTSEAKSYVLLSQTGEALFIDFGYDQTTWYPLGGPRHSQRPLLASLPALKRTFGVSQVSAVLTTHYHDDHVAGVNLLREVEGTSVWAPENVAPLLEQPMDLDLPCQWFDPIPVDRVLPLGEPVQWNEYTITSHPLPGHTHFAAAFEFEVDGVRVLATGDQQEGSGRTPGHRELLNYQYRNMFDYADYVKSVALYRRLRPQLMITGHWEPIASDEAFFDRLSDAAETCVEQHHQILPLDELSLPASGVLARLSPYECKLAPGQYIDYRVEVHNPLDHPVEARVRIALGAGWPAPDEVTFTAQPGASSTTVRLECPLSARERRCIAAVDLWLDDWHLGQVGESFIDVD